MEPTDYLWHPLTALSVIGSLVLSTLGAFGPVWDFIGASSGTWFPLVAVTAGTILPNVGFAELGTTVLVSAGVLYAAVYLDRFIDRLQEFINSYR